MTRHRSNLFAARCSLAALLLGVLSLGAIAVCTADEPTGKIDFGRQVRPLLKKYCHDCHSGEKPESDVGLDRYKNQAAAVAVPRVWEGVALKLRTGEMPPEDSPQPTADERALIQSWIEKEVFHIDCGGPRDPGRVTIRRLNRAEYNNTIRDLVGVDFQPADDFPADDVGYGFDNIGDVLSMPPILLEKYLTAAEKIAQAAIVDDGPPPVLGTYSGRRLKVRDGGRRANREVRLNSEGTVEADVRLPAEGEYLLRVRAYGEQAGPDVTKISLQLGDLKPTDVDVPAVEADPQVYEVRVKSPAGGVKFKASFINDYYQPSDPDPAKRDRNLVIEYLEIAGPVAPTALPQSHMRIIPREPTTEDRTALAREVVGNFATRAFRRPATTSEIDRLVKFIDLAEKEGDSFRAGVRLAMQAVLVSPHFLFRIELDPEPNNPKSIRQLGDFELATRLSYFLWSSMPDDELFALAREGKLREGDHLRQQVARMLKDNKAKALVENFAGQWLQLRNLKQVVRDPGAFPQFDDGLRWAMRTETEMFFAAIVSEDHSVLEFLDADFTFLNERLARHYGIEGVQGAEFRRVKLSGDQRGGVLSQASVLTVTSQPTRTAPVKRGKWILENLLGAAPPPPPPGVPELSEKAEVVLSGTLRQRLEQHRAKAECAVCHNRMDPLGFGLENYDAIGAWRSQDGKFPIDASGTLPGGQSFNGPRELKGLLKAKRGEFVRCLAEKLLTYSLGRGLEIYDQCTVNDLVAACEQWDYKFSSLVMAVVQTDAFQKRQGRGIDP